jgi:isoquinoline 1-oxidoreductase beta subunit
MSANLRDPGAADASLPDPSRRGFLKSSLATGGVLMIGVSLGGSLAACSKPQQAAGPAAGGQPNAWLKIAGDNTITILVDRSEMGQGVYTALPMLVAEELGVPLAAVKVEAAPPGDLYINALLGGQVTGGSTSVRDAWQKLRMAGAQARTMLVGAAADQWKVDASKLTVADGTVVGPDGKRATYGELAEAASKRPVPKDVALKTADQFTIVGKPQTRTDTPKKLDGSAEFGIDVKLPGMLYAALVQCPTLGGKAKAVDSADAEKLPGVKKVMTTAAGGVLVVADHYWQARKAADALKITWDAGPNAKLDTAAIRAKLVSGAPEWDRVARNDGDADAALKAAKRKVEATYDLPLLAHATMEPMNCTADVKADGCDVHVGTQVQQIAQGVAAKAAGLDPSKVRIHTTLLGGGFGRRLEVDFIPAAVEASKAVGAPVKVVWSREDDMTHDAYRPPAHDVLTAALDDKGAPQAVKITLVGPSITARMFPPVVAKDPDPFAVEAAANFLYDVPNVHVHHVRKEIGIDVGYWRSVSHALNCFVVESFVDELANAAKADPFEYRRAMLSKQPRAKRVLEEAADKAGWGKAPAGHVQGIALMEGYGTYLAQVAEISMAGGKLKIHRITTVVDCGAKVNPAIVQSQITSGIVYGLSAALWGDIQLKGGAVQETNFDAYRVLRLNEMPQLDVHLLDSTEAPGGIGEPSTALVAPAVCNAIHAATGKRLRALPIAKGVAI